MTLPQKLNILIKRKGVTKTEFAAMSGITYRALANYISEVRNPRALVIAKIAELLDTTPQFLLDNRQSLVLTSEERFVFNAEAESTDTAITAALQLLTEMRTVFAGDLSKKDKQALFSCMSEIYFAKEENVS
jgi:transcriptional regulator with XRE-family HTH domain